MHIYRRMTPFLRHAFFLLYPFFFYHYFGSSFAPLSQVVLKNPSKTKITPIAFGIADNLIHASLTSHYLTRQRYTGISLNQEKNEK